MRLELLPKGPAFTTRAGQEKETLMKFRYLILGLTLAALLFSSCNRPESPAAPGPSEQEEVDQSEETVPEDDVRIATLQAFFAAIEDGDLDAALDLYAEDGMLNSIFTGYAAGPEMLPGRIQEEIDLGYDIELGNFRLFPDGFFLTCDGTITMSDGEVHYVGIDARINNGLIESILLKFFFR
jgi:ketosteroid isomerase-like protein